jgi:predicted extracellular nuclease
MQGFLKWFLLLAFFLCLIFEHAKAQDDHYIVFYNVENLYDTFDDPKTDDGAFTSSGENHWTAKRFNKKILLVYKAIISACKGHFPDIIGLAEIENNWVAEQLISRTPFCKIPYGIIHKESPDPRGIDVALLYRKDIITPIDYEHIEVSNSINPIFASRDILHFTGDINGKRVHFFINHWPSRSGGENETMEKRNIAAKILRSRIDLLLTAEPDARILIAGDFNATPKEKCMVDILKALPHSDLKVNGSLVNLSAAWQNSNWGTIKRNGQWYIFDQIICSSNLLKASMFHIIPSKTEIGRQSFLLEPDIKYLGKKPNRTYLGPVYHGGVSDHLPIVTVLNSGE